MDYETVRAFSGTWGLIALVIMFLGIVAWALWPRNRKKFEDASRIPLEEDC